MPLSVAFATAAAVVWASACGPSVQLIYEGNLRFEHCYRLDLDEHITPTHRRACWGEWIQHYSKGQTRDRLEYAKRRLDAIEGGDGASQPLRLRDLPDAGPPVLAEDPAPVPTSVHAPPPARIQAPPPSSSVSTAAPDGGVEERPLGTATPDAGIEPGRLKHPKRAEPPKTRAKKPKP